MGRSTDKETGLSEQRKYRSWTAQQKIEIVLAGLRGDRSVKEVCREHAIAETLYYGWREKLLEGGREALAGKEERQGERELRRKVAELERALSRALAISFGGTLRIRSPAASRSRSSRRERCRQSSTAQSRSAPCLAAQPSSCR